MTYEDVLAEAEQLPLAERLRLLEEISRSVREALEIPIPAANGDDDADEEWRKEVEAERARLLANVPPESSLHRILGIARTRKEIPMTKEEDRDAIYAYRAEKYSR